MLISPFAIQNPISFGFDTPGPASTHPKGAVDSAAATGDERASEAAPQPPVATQSIDPMLLVYQERVESFRLVAAFVRRAFNALIGHRPVTRGTPRRATGTMATN